MINTFNVFFLSDIIKIIKYQHLIENFFIIEAISSEFYSRDKFK